MTRTTHTHSAALTAVLLLLATVAQLAYGQEAPAPPADADGKASAPLIPVEAWPRTYHHGSATLVLYQPQVDSWKSYAKIRFRAAFSLATTTGGPLHYGVLAVEADTTVDHESWMVMMTNLDLAIRFPGLAADQADSLKATVRACLPQKKSLDISLDEVVACRPKNMHVRKADISLAPPPIYYSDVPAILVTYIGQPKFKPIGTTGLMFAVNTNWVVLMDTTTGRYFLLHGKSWLTSPDPLKGPWTAAQELPGGFASLPAGKEWDHVRQNVPGVMAMHVPRVIATTKPAELIVTVGPPDYTPIPGTRLMYVSNPTMPLFLDLEDNSYYFLDAGRWFKAAHLTGPWTAASTSLPAEFAKIPPDGPMGSVLASVPGTAEAQDAVLLAQVPHKATVKIADAKLKVSYQGKPKFAPIAGTTMKYATNTAYQVVLADGNYYCCYKAVWFMAPAAAGPWVVCTQVPAVIYTIPATSPVYNVTYVKVYSATPQTVVVGYTAGYSGEYVAATGALMFGAGMIVGAALDDHWYCAPPCYYSYGCAAHYSYASGGYYRAGGACYGPHGGGGLGRRVQPVDGHVGPGRSGLRTGRRPLGRPGLQPPDQQLRRPRRRDERLSLMGRLDLFPRRIVGPVRPRLRPLWVGRLCPELLRPVGHGRSLGQQHAGPDVQRRPVRRSRRKRLPQHGQRLAEVQWGRQLERHVAQPAPQQLATAHQQHGHREPLEQLHAEPPARRLGEFVRQAVQQRPVRQFVEEQLGQPVRAEPFLDGKPHDEREPHGQREPHG